MPRSETHKVGPRRATGVAPCQRLTLQPSLWAPAAARRQPQRGCFVEKARNQANTATLPRRLTALAMHAGSFSTSKDKDHDSDKPEEGDTRSPEKPDD